jgi:hypothetical protein
VAAPAFVSANVPAIVVPETENEPALLPTEFDTKTSLELSFILFLTIIVNDY